MRRTPCESCPRRLAQTSPFAHWSAKACSTPAACRIAAAKFCSSAGATRIVVSVIPMPELVGQEPSCAHREEAIQPALDQIACGSAIAREREMRFSSDQIEFGRHFGPLEHSQRLLGGSHLIV